MRVIEHGLAPPDHPMFTEVLSVNLIQDWKPYEGSVVGKRTGGKKPYNRPQRLRLRRRRGKEK